MVCASAVCGGGGGGAESTPLFPLLLCFFHPSLNKPFKSTSSGPGAGEGSAGDTWLNTTVLLPSGDKGLEEIMGQNTPGTGEGNEEQVKGGCGG